MVLPACVLALSHLSVFLAWLGLAGAARVLFLFCGVAFFSRTRAELVLFVFAVLLRFVPVLLRPKARVRTLKLKCIYSGIKEASC